MLIFTHELGHFISAKLCHIKVNEFALGMGPAIFKIQRGETTYALRILPIGGFCAMEGEDEDSKDNRAFGSRPLWQRIIVVVSGATMNILTGFIIVLALTCATQSMASTTVSLFDKEATSNAPGGMKVGDVINRVNGAKVHVSTDIMYDLVLSDNGVVDIQVIRNGKLVDLKNVHFPMMDSGNGGKVMRRDFYVQPEKKTVFTVIHESFYQTVSMVRLVWMTFVELFKGRFGLKDLAGPIGTTAAVGQAAAAGVSDLLYVTALIAVNLGVVNLFPLPALDGGRLFFLIIEGIRRKKINPKYEGYVHFVGFALLMLLMIVVSYNDIIRLLKG